MEWLHKRFAKQGLVVLGVTDEKPGVVAPFVAKTGLTYPILIDAGRRVSDRLHIAGIPRTLIYDRTGKLAAQAMDMRTRSQLLALLGRAGLK